MEKKPIIKFTPAAEEQLEKFKHDQIDLLIEIIVSEKTYPGVDFIEITASDVQEQSKRIFVRAVKKVDIRYLLLFVYFIAGLSVLIYGIYYSEIKEILRERPQQAAFIIIGFFTSILSILMTFYIRQKEGKKRDYYFERYKGPIDIDDIDFTKITFENYKKFLEGNK